MDNLLADIYIILCIYIYVYYDYICVKYFVRIPTDPRFTSNWVSEMGLSENKGYPKITSFMLFFGK